MTEKEEDNICHNPSLKTHCIDVNTRWGRIVTLVKMAT